MSCPKRDGGGGAEDAAAAVVAANEADTAARVKEAVSRTQRETRRKYRARVAEVEAAFAQLAADNRRLKARVGQLSGVEEWVSGDTYSGGGRRGGGEGGGGGGKVGKCRGGGEVEPRVNVLCKLVTTP